MSEILIGVSACRLGEQVPDDGGHKRNGLLLEELASHVRFVPVCPEIAILLGIPRNHSRAWPSELPTTACAARRASVGGAFVRVGATVFSTEWLAISSGVETFLELYVGVRGGRYGSTARVRA